MNNSEWEIKYVPNAEINVIVPSNKIDSFVHGITKYDDQTIYINEEGKGLKKTLYHELCHCFMYEYGHNQSNKQFDCEDVCEILSSSYDIITKIVEDYYKSQKDGNL